MVRSEAKDAGGLTPAKDDNEAACHFLPLNFAGFQVIRRYTPPKK